MTWHIACITAVHVSLTKWFRCVDLRKFFVSKDQNTWKPTKTGIALGVHEWPTFKQAVEKLHRDNPTVANFTPSFLNIIVKKLNSLKHLVRTTLAESHN